jgi:hypothetical protein
MVDAPDLQHAAFDQADRGLDRMGLEPDAETLIASTLRPVAVNLALRDLIRRSSFTADSRQLRATSTRG